MGSRIRSRRRRAGRLFAAVALSIVAAFACRVPGTSLRAGPFPPDFERVPQSEIRSTMWVLAEEVSRLEALLEAPSEGAPGDHRSEVVRALSRMQAALRDIDRPGRTTQHPLLNENLPEFSRRLERARRAAERDPPSYFAAGTIAGSCFLCHGAGERVSAR